MYKFCIDICIGVVFVIVFFFDFVCVNFFIWFIFNNNIFFCFFFSLENIVINKGIFFWYIYLYFDYCCVF